MVKRANMPSQLDRREVLQTVVATVAVASASAAGGLTGGGTQAATPSSNASGRAEPGFWPNGARLAVSLSLMFEGGGQPISGAGGVIPDPIEKGVPDLPTNAFFAYGHYEGIPRLLDLMDKHESSKAEFETLAANFAQLTLVDGPPSGVWPAGRNNTRQRAPSVAAAPMSAQID